MKSEFIDAVKNHQSAFGLDLKPEIIGRLADYYNLVLEHNPLLHLVAPCSAEEFAIRHILESLTLLSYLPANARFADVGAGAGLPSVPCLLVRGDLEAVLIESKEKKTKFLAEAVTRLGIGERVQIINRQFEEAEAGDYRFITCRALDKFTQKLPRLLKWSQDRASLLFGGKALGEMLEKQGVSFTRKLLPLSEQRFLYVLGESAAGK